MGTITRVAAFIVLLVATGCGMGIPFVEHNPPPPPPAPAYSAAPRPDDPLAPARERGDMPAMSPGHSALEELVQGSPTPATTEGALNREIALAGGPVQDAPPAPATQTPPPANVQAQDAQTDEFLRKVVQERWAVDQEKRAESLEHLRNAIASKQNSDFETAKMHAERAIELWDGNLEAREVLKECNDQIVGREASGMTQIQQASDEIRARIQQNHIEINDHIRRGERFMATREYEAALKEFNEALFKVRAMPYAYEPVNQLKPGLENYIGMAQTAMADEKARQVEMQRAQAQALEVAAAEAHKREVLEFMADRLELAFMLFDQGKYDECMRMCDQLLVVDPHYVVARDLKDDARRIRHSKVGAEIIKAKIEGWQREKEAGLDCAIPYSDTVNFPDRDTWADISKRALGTGVQLAEPGTTEPDLLAVNTKLEKLKIKEFELNGLAFDEALAQLKSYGALNMTVDPVARKRVEDKGHFKLDLRLQNVSGKTALRTILAQYGLAYKALPGQVLYITTPDRAYAQPVPKLHEVADIIARTMDWEAPKFTMMPTRDTLGFNCNNAFIPLNEKEPEMKSRYDDVVALVKQNIAPGTWETGTNSIKVTPTKQLLVYHSPQVQDELKDFLSQLRSYTGTMVSITTRFLSTYDDFLEEAGVDVINQPAAQPFNVFGFPPSINAIPPQGTDINDFSGFRGPGLVIQENARTEYYDLRLQTFNTFRGGPGFADNRIGNRLLNTGGIGIQFQWLGEHAAQQVLTAVHKDSKTTLLQAPRITVFNTQRAHIMVVQQLAYIADYQAALTGAQGALDPTIGILMTGIVLDVRPIVSHDRKYVTIEMRPSLAELQTIRVLTIITAATNEGPFPANIQLPFVILQRSEATVVVPDRGSVMLSGFKDIAKTNVETQVPLLGDIPIISFFFQRKGETHERRRLMILVTPEIIDLQERESQEF